MTSLFDLIRILRTETKWITHVPAIVAEAQELLNSNLHSHEVFLINEQGFRKSISNTSMKRMTKRDGHEKERYEQKGFAVNR